MEIEIVKYCVSCPKLTTHCALNHIPYVGGFYALVKINYGLKMVYHKTYGLVCDSGIPKIYKLLVLNAPKGGDG